MTETTIFYLDDDPDDRVFFTEAALCCNANPIVFENPDAFLHALNNPPPVPGIIFVDLNMSLKSGYEVIQEIRSDPHFEFFPIVVLSTAATKSCVDKCYALGASAYLTKPFYFDLLIQSIKDIMSIDWMLFTRTRENFFMSIH